MSETKVDDGTEPQEEDTVSLFSKDFDDADLLDEVSEGTEQSADTEENQSDEGSEDSTIPEKYQGKSISDIIEMHQNLERAYGRHNNELGDLRQLTDTILKQQLGDTTSEPAKPLSSEDLLENPEVAIERAVSPKIKELEDKLEASERDRQLAAFKTVHPDAEKIVNDPRFVEWVQKSPTRVRLLQQADKSYDYDLAGELLTMYSDATSSDETERDEVRGKMTNAKPNATGGSKGKKKPVFTRSDLMRLRAEDPDRYEKLQPQILAAYSEGRVK